MITVSTPGLRVTQFSATWEMETPRWAAISGKRVDDSVEPLLIDRAGRVESVQPRLRGLRLAAAEFAGQEAELQGTPGHDARPLVEAGGHEFVFGVAGQQRIVDLLRDVARECRAGPRWTAPS